MNGENSSRKKQNEVIDLLEDDDEEEEKHLHQDDSNSYDNNDDDDDDSIYQEFYSVPKKYSSSNNKSKPHSRPLTATNNHQHASEGLTRNTGSSRYQSNHKRKEKFPAGGCAQQPRENQKPNNKNNDKYYVQTSLVVQEDDAILDDETRAIIERHQQQQFSSPSSSLILFEDEHFPALPSSIRGTSKDKSQCIGGTPPKCRCNAPAKLAYSPKQHYRPYYTCGNSLANHKNNNTNNNFDNAQRKRRCNFFSWAFQAERMQWFRFGTHTGHCLVQQQQQQQTVKNGDSNQKPMFAAKDLCQGRVGDCWFLSALAVVAERPDLIRRLFPSMTLDQSTGLIKVNLFVDGFWKTIVVDNFLPCLMVYDSDEQDLQRALRASLGKKPSSTIVTANNHTSSSSSSSSKSDPYAIADSCRDTLRNTHEYLEQHQMRTLGKTHKSTFSSLQVLKDRQITSQDLAYSKALKQQLWVPILEKAYAKSHGCYQAISGGHIAEAFLDLTGAPTLVYRLMQSTDFQPRKFWSLLYKYRNEQQLPMGCGTDSSAAGIVGMHAYSILKVVEIQKVPFAFFQETGVAHGNVSGFTEYDGTVRLLQIRNPHGQGEWKGDFSDQSQIWHRLFQYMKNDNVAIQGIDRPMRNDGTFWIDYDNFLMGFSNVDVVLAFLGNHAKSFATNFPSKKSNHRSVRAFEISLLEKQPGLPSQDKVELYVMGIQKTRRGATSGRVDRKKSYKVCDLGMLVLHHGNDDGKDEETILQNFASSNFHVEGQMFGFRRDGHYRLLLDRKKTKRVVVMPISFGHPAATDKELSFVLRFVSDAPLMIRELAETPRLDVALQKYCLHAPCTKGQGIRKVLLQQDGLFRLIQVDCRANGGGVVFLYLCVNETKLASTKENDPSNNNGGGLCFAVEATCRGMSCRCEGELLDHETIAKGKKFEAAWRKYKAEFLNERQSRLLLVLYQSGQDTEFGSIQCKQMRPPKRLGSAASLETAGKQTTMTAFMGNGNASQSLPAVQRNDSSYKDRGIFNAIPGNAPFEASKQCETGLGMQSILMDPAMVDADIIIDSDNALERAMEMSRDEYEFQHALTISRLQQEQSGHTTQNPYNRAQDDERDFQRILELSKREAAASASARATTPSEGVSSYEADLERAIRLSKQERHEKPAAQPVLDLTADENENSEDRAPKRARTKHTASEESKPRSLSEKRKLAAEAAMNRLRKI